MALTKAERTRKERTGKVLEMATDEAKKVHGNRESGTVAVTASLDVSDNDGTNTTNDGASATVSLTTSHEKTKNETK
jgi:hypothetical protein